MPQYEPRFLETFKLGFEIASCAATGNTRPAIGYFHEGYFDGIEGERLVFGHVEEGGKFKPRCWLGPRPLPPDMTISEVMQAEAASFGSEVGDAIALYIDDTVVREGRTLPKPLLPVPHFEDTPHGTIVHYDSEGTV